MIKITTLNDFIKEHIQTSLDQALSAERHPEWKRSCQTIDDVTFIQHGLYRCMTEAKSGRHYLQITDEVYGETIHHSSYFNALKSPRRMKMVTAVEKQRYQLQCDILDSFKVDYLKQFPELNDYQVKATDGHFFQHACHTEKNDKGKVFATGSIYALDLRYGLLSPVCYITNGTRRNHEIPAFRAYIERNNLEKEKGSKSLYVYDKAVMDFAWWEKQKSHSNFMISVLKQNSAATFVESIEFDRNDPVNTGIESDAVYKNKKALFHLVHYRDPETFILHRFISTLPQSINPGTIAMLYYKRWTIEKAFNNSQTDFSEKKAWAPSFNASNNQMRLISMSYNIARVFEAVSKAENPDLIHPSDKKYDKELDKRQVKANKKEGFVNPLFFHRRITRICSLTIRSIQNAIITKRSLVALMESLTGNLKQRGSIIVEH